MRDRLADCCRFLYLAHITPRQRVETWLESKTRTRADFGVRLHSIDFELPHYSAGDGLRVMGGRELIRMETVQDAFVACFQIIPFPCRLRNDFFQVSKVPRSAYRYFWGIHGNVAMAAANRSPLSERFH